jgi:peptidoglycan hydrolase CwlO-like protein
MKNENGMVVGWLRFGIMIVVLIVSASMIHSALATDVKVNTNDIQHINRQINEQKSLNSKLNGKVDKILNQVTKLEVSIAELNAKLEK